MNFALVGHNVTYSLSPKIHSVIYDMLHIDAHYGIISVPKGKLKEFTNALKHLDGFNVTQPHKEDIVQLLSENNSPLKAINTVKNSQGNLIGYNTDVSAFEAVTFESLSKLKNTLAVVEGAGGMARAAIHALKKHTDNICIVNRSSQKGQALAKELGVRYIGADAKAIKPKIYINCSSKELHSYGYEFPSFINTSQIEYAFDAIYLKTEFIELCKKRGIKCDNGLDMLILQAIQADEIFLNKKLTLGTIYEVKRIIGGIIAQ